MAVIIHHEQAHPMPYIDFLRRTFVASGGRATIPASQTAEGAVAAYVNHSRWIAECPDGCRWAVVASAQTPLFMCGACGNKAVGGKWRTVIFPQDKAAVEFQLLKRAKDENRNWIAGERVADLIRQNAAMGAI